MAVTLDRGELVRLARLGAEARLEALERERQQILRNFPGLRAGATPSTPERSESASRVRGRRAMSAAARKAVSERMTRYWAERRKAKAAGATKKR
jgi:hypothetical protein